MKEQLLKNICAVFLAGFMALLLLPQSAQAQKKEAYVVKSSDKKTLTFYYDDQKSSRTGTVWGIDETKEEDQETFPAWAGTMYTAVPEVTTVIFDLSFKNFLPKTTKNWFFNFTNLEEIKGLENLNSSEVTIMSGMFVDCEKLSQLNLSSFNTEKVQDMSGMFDGCSCLTSLNLSNFNTEKVTDMCAMFAICSALTQLDVSKFVTKNVTDMSSMFDGCAALTTIYCNDAWTCGNSAEMFIHCEKLKGAVSYDENKIDATMANPDTGYFTKKGPAGIVQTGHAATLKAVYSADGRRLKAPQPGVNIMKMSDGTTRKIVKR